MAILIKRVGALWIAMVSIFLTPRFGFTCANCFAASSRGGLRAYYISTAILTLMPFILIAGIAFVGYRSRRRLSVVHHDGNDFKPVEEIPCEYH